MIKIKVAILDDNPKDQEKVKEYFNHISSSLLQYECSDFSEIDDSFYSGYDVYFIDIELGEKSGLEIAKKLKEINEEAVLIIYSKHNDLVFESFKFGAFFFIRKDTFDEDMEYCQMRLNEHFISFKREYTYRFNQTIIHLNHFDILFVEKIGHRIEIHLKDGTVLEEYKSLKQFIEDLNNPIFIQCHQSYIVNLHHVKKLMNNDFLVGNKHVQISRRYLNQAKKAYINYLEKKV